MVAELAVEVVGGEAVLEAVPPHFPRGGVELGAVVDVGVQDGVEDLAASGDSVVREVGEGPEAGAVDAVSNTQQDAVIFPQTAILVDISVFWLPIWGRR